MLKLKPEREQRTSMAEGKTETTSGPVCETLQEARKKVIESEHKSGHSIQNYISISFKNSNQKAEQPVVDKVIVTTAIDSHQYP